MKLNNRFLKTSIAKVASLHSRAVFWLPGPKIFVNSIPKSGTHLLTNLLSRFPRIRSAHTHIRMPDIGRFVDTEKGDRCFRADVCILSKQLSRIRLGHFATAHFYYDADISKCLQAEGFKTIFLIRDPRAIAASRMRYIMELKRHPMHAIFKTELNSDQERLRACIIGMKGIAESRGKHLSQLSDDFIGLRELLLLQSGWINDPNVMTFQYERLRGSTGGGDDDDKLNDLLALARFIGRDFSNTKSTESLFDSAIEKSATFKGGTLDGWRRYFTADDVKFFETELGDLMETYGYSND